MCEKAARNCHARLALERGRIWRPNATSTTRSACRRGKAKWPDGAASTSEASAAYLHAGPASCCRYRVCYLHAPISEQPGRQRALRTRMQSHTPEAATSLTPQPCSPCCLHDGVRRCDLQGSGTCSTLSEPDCEFSALFALRPTLAANCPSLWLLPTPSGVGTIARGNIGKKAGLETLCVAAKRCSRRSIPDSRRIHHPSMSCTPAT